MQEILEKTLVVRAQSGERKAFKNLFELNVDKLYRFLLQFSRDHDQVSEWVQSAFIKAFTKIGGFNFQSKFSTWLFKIAINEMRTDWRREKSKKKYLVNENFNNSEAETYYIGEEFEWRHDLHELLKEIDETKSAIFILFEVEGYSHAEISEILGISESASRTYLYRVKEILKRKYLEDESNDRPAKIL